MKIYSITLLAFFLLGTGLMAQEEEQDTLKVQIGDKSISIVQNDDGIEFEDDDDDDCDSELTYWAGIDLGVNQLVNKAGDLERIDNNKWLELDPAKSLSIGFNVLEYKGRLIKNYVGIVTGLGLVYNSYGLADSVNVQHQTIAGKDSTYASFSAEPTYNKNKLRTTHLRVPLLLEFNTSDDEDRNFHLSGGVYGGWRIGAINKVEYDDPNGEEVKVRRKDDFNTSDFTLDATARIGYRGFTLFATYGLTPLFEKDKGPEVYPVTVGLTIVNF